MKNNNPTGWSVFLPIYRPETLILSSLLTEFCQVFSDRFKPIFEGDL